MEDAAIRAAIAMQECVGLQSVTDGEFRRASFRSPVVAKVAGFTTADPVAISRRYVDLINRIISPRPPGVTVAVHFSRGNSMGRWVAEGGYEAVAETVFGGLAVDALFLQYDTPRAGDFTPLRFVPAGRMVVLGLVSTPRAHLCGKIKGDGSLILRSYREC
jgi:5-methyltetrahydropteroyltriglutamate--homocysteine methyltransferase